MAILQKSDGLLTWCTDLAAAFGDAGAITMAANFRPASLAERWEQMTHKRRLLFNTTTTRRLAQTLGEFAPDLVIFLNYPSIPAAADNLLRHALGPRVPIIGWLCDSVTDFPAGYDDLLDGLYYFDTASLPTVERFYHGTRKPLAFLPLAASPRRYSCPGIDLRARKPQLVFAGNCTRSRQPFFADYRRHGLPLDLYGPRAANWPRVWRNRRLSSPALAHIYRQYLINLNLLQPGNTANGLNLRAFEIPCAGGLATYPDVPDLASCFVPNEEVLVYQNAADLADIVRSVARDPERALAVTRAGHRRVMREHTFYHRAVRILADWIGSSFQASVPDYIESSS